VNPFFIIPMPTEPCNCDLCVVTRLNPFWALYEIIGEA
jgi:hypothetical protein